MFGSSVCFRAEKLEETSASTPTPSASTPAQENIPSGSNEFNVQNLLTIQGNLNIVSCLPPNSQIEFISNSETQPPHFSDLESIDNRSNKAVSTESLVSQQQSFEKSEDFSDPASFANKKLSPQEINLALQLENQNLSHITFPVTASRKFNPQWRKAVLPNGSTSERKWLVYSEKKDAIFCLHCTLFALPAERSVWSTTGHRGWAEHRGEKYIELHEKSKHHISSQIARLHWITQNQIDKELAQQSDRVVSHNREVFSVIIDCCRFLSTEMLAFRKKDSLEGKLLNLFRLIAKYNPDARVYLEKLEKAKEGKTKLSSNFTSYRNVFDLVNIMSNMVVSKIAEKINETNTYSVILDSTQDVSKKECTAVLTRYVEHPDSGGIAKDKVKPQERLVKVFTSGDTSGENLSKELLKTLEEIGVNLNGMVGQSMDGAGNMRGKYSGVKSFVIKECPKAFYVWCCSHRFALVVEKSMDICTEMRNVFSLLQELYVFMSGHKRHHTFTENLQRGPKKNKGKRLKMVETTRWSSKSDALSTVISCYDIIRETLLEISEDPKSDNETKASAKGLYKALSDIETVSVMHIATSIFKILSPVTMCLQSQNIDYGTIPTVVKNTTSKLEKLRTDEEWQCVVSKVTKFTTDHSLQLNAPQRTRKRKRFMDELTLDEPPLDPLEKMKINVFFRILDSLRIQLEDRFPENSLCVVKQMYNFSHEGLLQLADNQERSNSIEISELCRQYGTEEEEVIEELQTFSEIYKDVHPTIDIADLLYTDKNEEEGRKSNESDGDESKEEDVGPKEDKTSKLRELDRWIRRGFIRPYRLLVNLSGFPQLTTMYRILLSLPATSCSAERTMSRLKIVKNRLRSSLGDTWLSSLLILSSEKDILDGIENTEIINTFGATTQQRRKLLLFKNYQGK